MDGELEFCVPAIPPSVNNYWKMRRFGGRYVTEEGVKFKQLVAETLRTYDIGVRTSKAMRLEIQFISSRWITKKGTVAEKDADNFVKCAQDALFEAIGVSDSCVFHLVVRKILSDSKASEGVTHYRLRPMDLEANRLDA